MHDEIDIQRQCDDSHNANTSLKVELSVELQPLAMYISCYPLYVGGGCSAFSERDFYFLVAPIVIQSMSKCEGVCHSRMIVKRRCSILLITSNFSSPEPRVSVSSIICSSVFCRPEHGKLIRNPITKNLKLHKDAFQKLWGVLAFLCKSTYKSIDQEMAFLCHGVCDVVLSCSPCYKMVALVLRPPLWLRSCLVQPLLHRRKLTRSFWTPVLVLRLWLQNVCVDVDGADGPRDQTAWKEAHVTGLLTFSFLFLGSLCLFKQIQISFCLNDFLMFLQEAICIFR